MEGNATELTGFTDEAKAGVGLVTVALAILTVALNSLAIVSFVVFSSLRDKSSDFLILNLAVTDLLLGLLVLPFSIARKMQGEWYFGSVTCKLWRSFDVCLCLQTLWTAMFISVDKYVYTSHPQRYTVIVTTMRLRIIIVSSWCVAVAFSFILNMTDIAIDRTSVTLVPPDSCMYVLDSRYAVSAFFVNFACPSLVILGTSYHTFRAVNQQHRQVEALMSNNALHVRGQGIQADSHQLSEVKSIKALSVLLTILVVMWSPRFVVLFVDAVCYCVHPVLLETCTWIGYCNSVVNPMLYAFNDRYRKAYRKLLHCDFHSEVLDDSDQHMNPIAGVSRPNPKP
ncbi:5-hydroxytryptamine receptor 6-like [Saccoglossus kowalevskii]|uniref:Octopamine receptor 1-like n=1 Tax=Saccoglossus kowalevskii TaxID=10224 RepID=A0ABM0MEW2_SACKO|nr:PREDICTED: octopamine receptor 1-like [Saccoglossus kowalevskii]